MSFDAIAPLYERLAHLVFGQSLRMARWALLPLLPPLDRVLIVGGGTGELLLGWPPDQYPKEIYYLEPSTRMIQLARHRWAEAGLNDRGEIHWRKKTLQQYEPETQVAALTTCFVLDLFEAPEVIPLIDKLDQILLPEGYWLYVDFCAKQPWQQRLVSLMYVFFRWTTGVKTSALSDVPALLEQRGYRMVARKTFRSRLIEAVLFQKQPSSVHP